eukprot:355368-Chlamydomonas_euryale.AAC.25
MRVWQPARRSRHARSPKRAAPSAAVEVAAAVLARAAGGAGRIRTAANANAHAPRTREHCGLSRRCGSKVSGDARRDVFGTEQGRARLRQAPAIKAARFGPRIPPGAARRFRRPPPL